MNTIASRISATATTSASYQRRNQRKRISTTMAVTAILVTVSDSHEPINVAVLSGSVRWSANQREIRSSTLTSHQRRLSANATQPASANTAVIEM